MKGKLLVILFNLAILLGCSKDYSSPIDPGWEAPGDGKKSQLTVMSYNIRHCAPYYGTSENTTANVNNVAEVIKKIKPDVVFLQEVDKNTTRSLGIDQAKKLAEFGGYPYYQFFKIMDYQGGEFGLAILSALELKEAETHAMPSEIDGQIITSNNALGTAKITFNSIDINLAVVHLSVNQTESEKQLPYILEKILANKNGPALLAGDFNSTPFSSTIKKMDAGGYTRTNTDPTKFSIPSNSPNRELDYISFKPKERFTVESHTVLTGISASDHLPIVSILNVLKP